MQPGNILIVDDEANIRRGLRAILVKEGHQVREAGSAEEALPILQSFACEAAIVDIRMPGMTGEELLHEIRARWPAVSVILLTGHGTLETAMTAVKEGAFDYLLKPAQPGEIRQSVTSALAGARRAQEQAHLFATIRGSLARMGQLPEIGSPGNTVSANGLTQDGPADHPEIDDGRYLTAGDLVIDLRGYEVRLAGEAVALTPSEFRLLAALAQPGRRSHRLRHSGPAEPGVRRRIMGSQGTDQAPCLLPQTETGTRACLATLYPERPGRRLSPGALKALSLLLPGRNRSVTDPSPRAGQFRPIMKQHSVLNLQGDARPSESNQNL